MFFDYQIILIIFCSKCLSELHFKVLQEITNDASIQK
jgi:hypothetical protein